MSADGRRGFVGVDRHWIADGRLADSDLRLMLFLDSHTDEYLGKLGITRVAAELGWSRNKVKRSMENLIDLGLISSYQVPMKGGGTRTEIRLHQSVWSDRDAGPQRTSAVVHDETCAVVHDGPPTNSNPNVEESTVGNPQTPATGEVVSRQDALFDSFWQVYPRKVGKPAAKRAFMSKLKQVGLLEMRAGCWAWIAYWRDARTDVQYIPHPATFLNQERYMDEPPPIVAGNSKSAQSMTAIEKLFNRLDNS